MGAVLPFPADYKPAALREQPAEVLILPVLRRQTDGGRSRKTSWRRSAQRQRLAEQIAAWEASACPQG